MDALFLAWQLTALASGLLSTGAMVYFFIKYRSARVHPGPVLLCIFLSVSIASISRVGLHSWHFLMSENSEAHGTPLAATISRVANHELLGEVNLEPYVPFFFWCHFFFQTSATLWVLMLALDLIFSLSNPFLPFHADNVKHHVYAWPASLLYCVIFRYVFVNSQAHMSRHVMLYVHLPAYTVFLYISGALILAWRRSRRLETHAHETTRRMAKRITPYLGVFALDTLVSFTIYLVQLAIGFSSTTPNALDQLTLVLESLAIFTLFCRDAGIFRAISRKNAARQSGESASSNPSRTTVTQLGGTTITATTGPARTSSGDQPEKIDVSNQLRMDVMRYMSLGIMKSIEHAQEERVDESGSAGRTRSDAGDEETSGGYYSDVTYDDYNREVSMGVIVYGQKNSSRVLNFRDCAPKVFHRIRALFNIDQDVYMQSFDPTQLLSEHGSEGKSGNIFYFTANKKFMVKSVPKEEFDTLRAILPQYHEYLQSNPGSMLCRYFGCHSISLPIGTRRMYFVVMQNLFNEGPVDMRFDLKGNRDRRQAVSANQMEGLIQRANDKQPIGQLMMDIDFRQLSTGISLSYEDTTLKQDQICSDVVFLASRGIIDYSILLGVRFRNPNERLASSQESGISSHDQEKVYYLGIVDMLQRYNWRWAVQRWVLGILLCKDTHDVSAVPPAEYGTRLTDFVRERLFDIQDSSSSASSSRRGDYPATDQTGASGYSSNSSTAHPEHTTINMQRVVNSRSEEMRNMAVFSSDSLDSQGLMYQSSSSSPSVAYSSVCESPASSLASEARKSTFFV